MSDAFVPGVCVIPSPEELSPPSARVCCQSLSATGSGSMLSNDATPDDGPGRACPGLIGCLQKARATTLAGKKGLCGRIGPARLVWAGWPGRFLTRDLRFTSTKPNLPPIDKFVSGTPPQSHMGTSTKRTLQVHGVAHFAYLSSSIDNDLVQPSLDSLRLPARQAHVGRKIKAAVAPGAVQRLQDVLHWLDFDQFSALKVEALYRR